MKKVKRKLALLLSFIMLMANINAIAFENNATVGVDLHSKTIPDERIEVIKNSEITSGGSVEGVVETITDEVIYNIGNMNVTVGYDLEKSVEDSRSYKLFDDNNSYTIEVEKNAFFPYEVQFTYDGVTFVEWFDTPDSTVNVGEFEFNIHSEYDDSKVISQFGVWIGDEYVPAMPEAKEFKDLPYEDRTLLPIEEEFITLDFSDRHIFELYNVKISTIVDGVLSGSQLTENDVVLYADRWSEGEYSSVNMEGFLNLNEYENGQFNLIIGSGQQLDMNNKKYQVSIIEPVKDTIFSYDIYKVIDGVKSEPNILDENVDWWDNYTYNYYTISESDYNSDNFMISMSADLPEGATLEIYEGRAYSVDEAEALTKITEQIVNVNLSQKDGYIVEPWESSNRTQKNFSIVINYNGNKALIINTVYLEYEIVEVEFKGIYENTNSTYPEYVDYTWQYDFEDGIVVRNIQLRDGYTSDEDYRVIFKVENGSIEGAFVGNYDTLEEAKQSATDIKEQLFASSNEENGYVDNFSGDGIVFTIFTSDNRVEKMKIRAISSEIEGENVQLPTPGSVDTNFNAVGLLDYNSYALYHKHDTYYDMGYQTIFVQDKDVDLSNVKLGFVKGSGVNVYSGDNGNAGVIQESGITVQDFSNGPVQYAAASENGEELKNYWVTMVKQQTGPSLFVNGINGEEGAVREVFLTSRHDFIHDIFIANIGDEDITNLNVELIDAQNVKLDEYWTIGGENNNVLGAFTFENTENADIYAYGYSKVLDNVKNAGKIRLVPLDDNGGEVSGTLKITADGIEAIEIELKGNAGDPSFVTDEIPRGVKFVPYAIQLMQNNKYYWNKVTFDIISGKLPNGIELKENGEIYGVPLEAGNFTVKIKLNNSDNEFDDQTRMFEFEIKENTNENVESIIDEGYALEIRAGNVHNGNDVVDVSLDTVFQSEGEFEEFQEFWLNGEKLVRDTDYIAEDGSTKITIKSQTLKNKALKDSTNTIAAEFRVNADINEDLKRTAQNFVVTEVSTDGGDTNNGNSGGNSSGGSSSRGSSGSSSSEEKPTQEVISSTEEVINTISLDATEIDGVLVYVVDEQLIDNAMEELGEISNDKIYSIVIEAQNIEGSTSSFSLSQEILSKLANYDNITLVLNAPGVYTIKLEPKTIKSLVVTGEDVVINLLKELGQVTLQFYAGETLLQNIDGGVKVVLHDIAHGEVALAIDQYGVEEIVKKSIINNSDIYAIINGSCTAKVVNNSKKFSDVSDNAWYKETVNLVSSRGLLQGISDDNFAPNLNISRSMIVSVLQRIEGVMITNVETTQFNDVPQNKWYSASVDWASNAGIINYIVEDNFSPTKEVTREELALILYNYANYSNMDTKARGDMTQFADSENVSQETNDALRWAVASDFIVGDGTNINAKESATRAEVSAIVMRFIDTMVK